MINVNNDFKYVSASLVGITTPKTQNITWNPKEYKIININTEKGIIEFERIESE